MAIKEHIREKPTSQCAPEDIALKSYFLGPQAENAAWVNDIVKHVFQQWFDWRRSLYASDGRAISDADQDTELFQRHIHEFKAEIDELSQRFNSEVPSFSPRYIGHMVSEVSLPALMGHILTLLYNPNNISGEVSRVGLEIEQNAIGALISMVGFDARQSTGHFTSGGTVANLESALRARARMYRWIAAGAAARKLGLYQGSIFESAHMGWDVYDGLSGAIKEHIQKAGSGDPGRGAGLSDKISAGHTNPESVSDAVLFTDLAGDPGAANTSRRGQNRQTRHSKTGPAGFEADQRLDARLREYHLLTGNPFDTAYCLSNVFEEAYRGPVVLVPGNKHYSWNKAVEILGLGEEAFWQVETDEQGKLDPGVLLEMLNEARAAGRPVMMVVSVAGTTELGEVDPIDEIQEIIDTFEKEQGIHIWHHVDAAYGGFFCTLKHDKTDKILEAPVRRALRAVGYVNSVTIDPHKLGFVPYASGAFLCGDRREYHHTTIDAPYIDFRPGADVGVSSLEGSRSAAGAVSTWLTSRVIGFDRPGYGRILERTVLAARKLAFGLMDAHPWIRVNKAGDTNIVTFCIAKDGEKISETNRRTLEIFERYASAKKESPVPVTGRKPNRNSVVNRSVGTKASVSDEVSRPFSAESGGLDGSVAAIPDASPEMAARLGAAQAYPENIVPGRPPSDEKYFVSKTTLSLGSYRRLLDPYTAGWQAEWDTEELVLLRLVLLNPFLDTRESNVQYIESFIEDLAGVVENSF